MQIDWTTFILEIINFLVLVWILKRFLYKPVLDALDARAAKMREQSQQAEKIRNDAQSLKQQYETRLEEWNNEREEKRATLVDELAKEHVDKLNKLQKSLEDERTKAAAREDAITASREKVLLKEAEKKAYKNAAALLTRLADAPLTTRIAEILAEDIADLPEEKCAELRLAAEHLDKKDKMEIASAHKLDEAICKKIIDSIEKITGQKISYKLTILPELISGLRISLGECVLHINIADELAFFQQEKLHG